MKAIVFPGQGSQIIGMGKNLYNKYNFVKEMYEMANEIFKYDLTKIIFEGPIEDLKQTNNAQAAIMLTSIALLKVLLHNSNKNITEIANYLAGHSLGEYSALVAANSISVEDAIKLLKVRGKAMNDAVPNGVGGMLAIIGVSDIDIIKNIANEANSEEEVCVIANDNSVGQVILSGHLTALKKAEAIAKEKYKVRITKMLEVSGPFHSILMKPAKNKLQEELQNIQFKKLDVSVIANVTAQEITNENQIKDLLLSQITGEVKWRESMLNLTSKGVNQIVEIGPSKVLTGLMKRIDNNVECVNIESEEDIEKFIQTLNK